jgi:integrase
MKDRSCPSEKTIEERESVFRLRVNPIIGNQRLHQLRDHHIHAFYKLVNDHSETVGHSTVLFHTFKVFNGFLNWAVKRGYIVMNPTSPNTQETVKAWIAAAKRESGGFDLTEKGVADILVAVAGKPHAITFHLMVRSGLRRAEALAAKWDDIDFDRQCINVYRQVQEVAKRVLVGTRKESETSQILIAPKTRAGIRSAPLQGDTIQLLVRTPLEHRTGYLFQTSNGKPIHSSTFRGRVFKPVMKEVGLPNVTPHDLRRYCGTELLALAIEFGTDLEEVKLMMGHSKLSTTLDIYAQSRLDLQKRFRMALANRNVA